MEGRLPQIAYSEVEVPIVRSTAQIGGPSALR